MVRFTIDGKEIEAKEGTSVLEAARYHGFYIPTLCYHEAVSPSGACRLCVVEVDEGGRRRVVVSCMYPVKEGIEVFTDTERVRNVRRWILEMLLAECPASERVRELAASHGVHSTRFEVHDPTAECVLCGLCVRVCAEVVGVSALTTVGRGVNKRISTAFMHPDVCVGCGSCVSICPTGAMARIWEEIRPKGAVKLAE